MEIDEIDAIGRVDPAIALLLDLKRQAGLRSTKKRDGWTPFDQERFAAIGLADRRTRHWFVKRLLARAWIEVRSRHGRRLEYRLNPNWAKAKAEVVDLAAVRKAQKR
jgi:hypothetical protein